MEQSKPSDSLPSPNKSQPSDHQAVAGPSCITTTTPKKLSEPPRRMKHHRNPQLPDKYDMLLRFFHALDASLRLLRFRKSMPVFSTVKSMIEKMSERRFTYQHLAQLKFLLPEVIGVRRVMLPDEETRCMKYDLRLSLNVSTKGDVKKRKRVSKGSCLRDRCLARLLEFRRAHPEGTEIPEEELPEPFNQRKHNPPLVITNHLDSFTCAPESSDVGVELQRAQASHICTSFKKHFSKQVSGNEVKDLLQSSSNSVSKPSTSEDISESVTLPCPTKPSEVLTKDKLLTDTETCSIQIDKMKARTPLKSAGTLQDVIAATPALQTPKRPRVMSPGDEFASSPHKLANHPSCARSLLFDGPSRNDNIELQLDDVDCSNIHDILPSNLLQLLKEKESRTTQPSRKHMLALLPRMFDRICYLFQNPRSTFLRKEALIRDLTECHADITDQSEIEEQLKLLQQIIPELISHKLSPSGNILYSINKTLSTNALRLKLEKAL